MKRPTTPATGHPSLTKDGNKSPWAKLDKLRGPAAFTKKPEGGFTAAEYAGRYGLSRAATGEQIAKLVHAGVVIELGKLAGTGGAKVYKLAE